MLTTRAGSVRKIVKVEKSTLADFANFKTLILEQHPEIASDAKVTFNILMPIMGGTNLMEVEISDVSDLATLK